MPSLKLLEVHNPENFVITSRNRAGAPEKARCLHCSWHQTYNVTRMFTHLQEHQPLLSSTSSTSQKKRKIDEHFPGHSVSDTGKIFQVSLTFSGALSAGDTLFADKRLVFAAIRNGWSFNSLESGHLDQFLQAVRPGYHAPSAYKMGVIRDNLLKEVNQRVKERLVESQIVTLAFDGWTNHAHTSTLAIAAITRGLETFVLSMSVLERETAEVCELEPPCQLIPVPTPGLASRGAAGDR